jgi:hypothetical protein
MREVIAIEPKWLLELAPRFFQQCNPRNLSKRKRQERIEPLYDRFNDPNAVRDPRSNALPACSAPLLCSRAPCSILRLGSGASPSAAAEHRQRPTHLRRTRAAHARAWSLCWTSTAVTNGRAMRRIASFDS